MQTEHEPSKSNTSSKASDLTAGKKMEDEGAPPLKTAATTKGECTSSHPADRTKSAADTELEREVKKAFSQAQGFQTPDFKISCCNGEVELSGYVASQNDIQRASAIAEKVKGAKSVALKLAARSAHKTGDARPGSAQFKNQPGVKSARDGQASPPSRT